MICLPPRCSLASGAVLAAAVVSSACGMRGAPLPPLVIVPEAVPLSVTRLNDEVYVGFDMPTENSDGSIPVDLDRVELYALTTHPDPDRSVSLELDDWLDLATLVATIPAPGEDKEALVPADDEATADDAADDTDEISVDDVEEDEHDVVILEVLTPGVRQPVALDDYWEDDDDSDDLEEEPTERLAPEVPPLPAFPRRTYRAVAISTRGREAPSAPADVTLAAPTPAPGPPAVTHTEFELLLEWAAPAAARVPVQVPAVVGVLPSTPIITTGSPSTYRIYALGDGEDGGDPVDATPLIELVHPLVPPPPAPLNFEDLDATTFVDPALVFGVNRCYIVRTVDRINGLEVVGPPSAQTCIVPKDTFPPSSPTGLIAVGTGGGINLVWDASPQADVVGYVVLRGDAPGATLERLTPEPVVETAFRDTTVEADQRYVYAVQAVDGAEPPNLSTPSSEAAEQAR